MCGLVGCFSHFINLVSSQVLQASLAVAVQYIFLLICLLDHRVNESFIKSLLLLWRGKVSAVEHRVECDGRQQGKSSSHVSCPSGFFVWSFGFSVSRLTVHTARGTQTSFQSRRREVQQILHLLHRNIMLQ